MPYTQSIKRQQSVDWIQSAKKQKTESSENEMLRFFSKYFREEMNTVEESLMSKQKEINKLTEIVTTKNNELQSYKRENLSLKQQIEHFQQEKLKNSGEKTLLETLASKDQEIINLNNKLSGWEEENDQMVNEISELKEELKVKEDFRLEAVKVAKELRGKLRKNDQTLYQQKEELRVLQRKNNFSDQEILRLKSDLDLEDAKRRRRDDENLHIIEEMTSVVFNRDQEIEKYKSQVSDLETKLEEARLLIKRSEDNEEIIEVLYNFNAPTKYGDDFFDSLEKKGLEIINRAEDKR